MKTIEERAEELYRGNTIEMDAYKEGRNEQKAIDDIDLKETQRQRDEYYDELVKLRIEKAEWMEKACEWLKNSLFFGEDGICIGSYTDTTESILNDFCKAMKK